MNEPRYQRTPELELPLLVLRCQAGDEAAFVRLFETFGPRTQGYLRGLVEEEAEDVQQEVWLSVYRQLAGLADPRAFRTWLYRLTRHRAIDHLRRQRRAAELFVENADAEAVADPGAGADEGLTPDLAGPLLNQLPALQREALLLRYRDELSYQEIALIAGCSVGTVRSRLHYGRQRLTDLAERAVGQE